MFGKSRDAVGAVARDTVGAGARDTAGVGAKGASSVEVGVGADACVKPRKKRRGAERENLKISNQDCRQGEAYKQALLCANILSKQNIQPLRHSICFTSVVFYVCSVCLFSTRCLTSHS